MKLSFALCSENAHLSQVINGREWPFAESDVLTATHQLLLGVRAIHDARVLHRVRERGYPLHPAEAHTSAFIYEILPTTI